MPLDDPIKALEWIVPKLLKDLTEAKILPIKMANLKHQQKLRHFDFKDDKIYLFFHIGLGLCYGMSILPCPYIKSFCHI